MKNIILLASSVLFLNSCGNVENAEIGSEVFNQTAQYQGLRTHKLNNYITLVHDDRPANGPVRSHGKGYNFSMSQLDLFSQATFDEYLRDCKFFTQGQTVPANYLNFKISSPLQQSWAIVCQDYYEVEEGDSDEPYSYSIAISDGHRHGKAHQACKTFYNGLAKETYENKYEVINADKLKFVSITKDVIACRIK